MAYQRVQETAEVRIVFDVQSVEVSNLFYAEHSGGYNQAGIDALAVGVDNNASGGFIGILSTRDAYVRTEVRGLDAEYDLTASVNTSAAAGINASLPVPLSTSFVVTQISGLTGKSAQGRTYAAGVCLNHISGALNEESELTTVAAAAWMGVIDGVRTVIDAVGLWDPVLVSRYHNGAKRSEGLVFPWTSSIYNSVKVASRRKRLR